MIVNRSNSSKFVAALLSVLVASPLALFGVASPAAAHDQLISSSPADQRELSTPPSQIRLTFNDAPMKGTPKIIAGERGGDPVILGTPTIEGKTVTVPWPAKAAGTYGVTWRVVSSDGHPINGSFAFRVQNAGTASSSPSVPVESPSTSNNTPGAASPAANTNTSSSNTGGMLAGLAAALMAAVVLVAILVRRRQGKDDDVS